MFPTLCLPMLHAADYPQRLRPPPRGFIFPLQTEASYNYPYPYPVKRAIARPQGLAKGYSARAHIVCRGCGRGSVAQEGIDTVALVSGPTTPTTLFAEAIEPA